MQNIFTDKFPLIMFINKIKESKEGLQTKAIYSQLFITEIVQEVRYNTRYIFFYDEMKPNENLR